MVVPLKKLYHARRIMLDVDETKWTACSTAETILLNLSVSFFRTGLVSCPSMWTLCPLLRLVHLYFAALQHAFIQGLDGLVSFGIVRHVDKPEPLGLAGKPVLDKVDAGYFTVFGKYFPQFIFPYAVRQLAHINIHTSPRTGIILC
jgi:hypothetical protein